MDIVSIAQTTINYPCELDILVVVQVFSDWIASLAFGLFNIWIVLNHNSFVSNDNIDSITNLTLFKKLVSLMSLFSLL